MTVSVGDVRRAMTVSVLVVVSRARRVEFYPSQLLAHYYTGFADYIDWLRGLLKLQTVRCCVVSKQPVNAVTCLQDDF